MSGFYRDIALSHDTDPGAAQRRSPVAVGGVPITVIEPEGTARGGIVVLHESRGFADALLKLMMSLSSEGWIVLAPNLFHRDDDGSAPGEFADERVFGTDLFTDFDACFEWLVGHGVFPDCIGVLGFDSAGTAAVLVATNRRIGAVVSVAARGIVEPLTDHAEALIRAAPALQAPWLGLYGADDPDTPPEQIEQLRDAAGRAMVATLVVSYPGLRHRADRPGFDAPGFATSGFDSGVETVADAQTRIFDWFDSHLR